eukprot:UN00843
MHWLYGGCIIIDIQFLFLFIQSNYDFFIHDNNYYREFQLKDLKKFRSICEIVLNKW